MHPLSEVNMQQTQGSQPPKVFISYSHDNPKHKKWVADLASKLVDKGIDITLDQWELSLGDDVPKFMQNALRASERVLVICTENYVRKANDGEGGVGYEAMIVTAEIIRDLGTKKFIPVVRQVSATGSVLPDCLGARFYCNLSDDRIFQDEFDVLLRELHKVPSQPKPALGRNPFAVTQSGEEVPERLVEHLEPMDADFQIGDSVEAVYRRAIRIAKSGDFLEWRGLIRTVKSECAQGLLAWRKVINEKTPGSQELALSQTLDGVDQYAKLICVALAGVESGREKFRSQTSLVDDFMYPQGWPRDGLTYYIRVPHSTLFIYQALHGALAMQTHQLGLAVALARSKVKTLDMSESLPICQSHEIVGWPKAMGQDAIKAWDALEGLYERWPWLSLLFGDKEEYVASLISYYMALNTNELALCLAENGMKLPEDEHPRNMDVPLVAFLNDRHVQSRAYRLLIQDPDQVRGVWESLKVPFDAIDANWKEWMNRSGRWIGSLNRFLSSGFLGHADLINDLKRG